MHALPTTPGSIVTFDLPPDSDGSIYRAVAALIPGHIDEHGTVHSAVWASAELQDPEDMACVFSEEAILRSNPEILVETEAADDREVEDLREPGTVIRVTEHGIPMTYTFAPSFMWDGEMQDLFWTNSYGGYLSGGNTDGAEVLYQPRRRA